MNRLFLASLLAVVAGCPPSTTDLVLTDDGKTDGTVDTDTTSDTDDTDDTDPVVDVTWELSLTIDELYVEAGTEVPYSVTLESSAGNTPTVDPMLTSDIDSALVYSPSVITALMAGDHIITATVDYGGAQFEATAELKVSEGPADRVDLILASNSVEAGATLPFSIEAFDAYNNPLETQWVGVVANHPDILIDLSAGTITSTRADDAYELTAQMDTATDVEPLTIEPAPAISVDLSLSLYALNPNNSTVAAVSMLDIYGNQADDDYTLYTTGPYTPIIAADTILFRDEGIYDVHVDVDNTALTDSDGPVKVDGTGPDLFVDNPDRGDHSSQSSITVTGTAADATTSTTEVTVNGAVANLGGADSFSSSQLLDFGLNVVETIATDEIGNTRNDIRGMLSGELLGAGQSLPDAFLVRLEEGAGGLGVLEALGEDLVAETDLDALIPYPLYSDESETCFLGLCFTWYSIFLWVDTPTFSSTDMFIDPQSDGSVDVTFTVYDPNINWHANAVGAEIPYNDDGWIDADYLWVTLTLDPGVSNGQVTLDLASVSSGAQNLSLVIDSFLGDILDFFGFDFSTDVEDALTDAVDEAVRDEVPALIEEVLQTLELEFEFDLGGVLMEIVAEPSSVSTTWNSIVVGLGTTVTSNDWVLDRDLGGSLFADYSHPAWVGSAGTSMAISLDFLNQVLDPVWGAGTLQLSLSATDLGLSSQDLALLFPGVTDITLGVDGLLPPVSVPLDATQAELQLGAMRIGIDEWPAGTPLVEAYMSATAEFGLDSNGATLTATVGDIEAWVDVTEPETGEEALEFLLESMVPLLLPSLVDVIGEFEIPEIEGFVFTPSGNHMGGPEQGYYVMDGSITAAP